MIYTSMPNGPITMTNLVVHVLKIRGTCICMVSYLALISATKNAQGLHVLCERSVVAVLFLKD